MKKYLHEFLKFSNGTIRDNGWWEIDGDRLLNEFGGWHDYQPEEDDVIVEAKDYLDLRNKVDFSYLIKNDSKYGWLAPDGTFYGCDSQEHNELAVLYFKKDDEEELEEEGYLKIFDSNGKPRTYVFSFTKITKEQAVYLLEHGIRC